jgi:hypothetical protein
LPNSSEPCIQSTAFPRRSGKQRKRTTTQRSFDPVFDKHEIGDFHLFHDLAFFPQFRILILSHFPFNRRFVTNFCVAAANFGALQPIATCGDVSGVLGAQVQ